jgi:steroid delta-isomerase
MATPDEIRATLDAYRATFSANDREAWLDLFTADATVEDPIGSELQRGREAIGAFFDTSHSMADSIELRPARPVPVAGHEAAMPFTIVVEVGGSKMAIDAIDAMTFAEDGRITSQRAYWDMAAAHPLED